MARKHRRPDDPPVLGAEPIGKTPRARAASLGRTRAMPAGVAVPRTPLFLAVADPAAHPPLLATHLPTTLPSAATGHIDSPRRLNSAIGVPQPGGENSIYTGAGTAQQAQLAPAQGHGCGHAIRVVTPRLPGNGRPTARRGPGRTRSPVCPGCGSTSGASWASGPASHASPRSPPPPRTRNKRPLEAFGTVLSPGGRVDG